MKPSSKPSLEAKTRVNLKQLLVSFKNFFLSTRTSVGIDIGYSYVKIAQFQKVQKGYLISDYRVRGIPFNIKDDFNKRREFIERFIKEFLFQTRIKSHLGRLVVQGRGIFIFSFILPFVSEKDLRGAVSIELKKRLPFQVNFKNITFDYFITHKFETEKGNFAQVTCIAVDNLVLEEYLNFLKKFNLRPVVINVIPDALGNLVGSFEKETQYIAVLDIGAKESSLNFYKGRLLQFNHQIPIGADQFTHAIMRVLSDLNKDVTIEDAEVFKRECGIPLEEAGTDFYTDFGVIKGSQIAGVLRPLLERMITEVSRTMAFYFRTYKVESLDVFYLTGGGSRMKNIKEFFSANLSNLPIKKIEKLNPLKIAKGWFDVGVFRQELIMEEAAPHLASVFGVCIDKGGRLNLVPPKEKLEQKALFLMFLARITFPLIFTILLGFYAFSYGRALLYKGVAKRMENQIRSLTPLVKEIKEYLLLKKTLAERESLLKRAVGRQPLWWAILKELSNITPKEITLHRLEIVSRKGLKELTIIGEVATQYTNLDLAISQYTLNLDESPFFTNVRLISSERDMYSPIPKANFEIICEIVY